MKNPYKCIIMPDNKLVIRRLPPSMGEDDFLKQVSPLPEHDYFCFFEASSGLGPHSYSRAYINFLEASDMDVFKERFDNYVFLDKDGHEYLAVVEQSLWHKSPKSGPYYRSKTEQTSSMTSVDPDDVDALSNCQAYIEQDPEFISFVENLQTHKRRTHHSPIQTLETNLDELTNPANTTYLGNKDSSKVMTPLIGYVNKQRGKKSAKKAK